MSVSAPLSYPMHATYLKSRSDGQRRERRSIILSRERKNPDPYPPRRRASDGFQYLRRRPFPVLRRGHSLSPQSRPHPRPPPRESPTLLPLRRPLLEFPGPSSLCSSPGLSYIFVLPEMEAIGGSRRIAGGSRRAIGAGTRRGPDSRCCVPQG